MEQQTKIRIRIILVTIVVTLSILAILIGAYLGYNYKTNQAYETGYKNGALYVSQSGVIPYLDQNKTIQTIKLADYCGMIK